MAKVEIDEGSGFCFGVVTAINKAEEELSKSGTLYCLGDIVHNSREVERLKAMGLITINHEEFNRLHNAKVLLRAHGDKRKSSRSISRKTMRTNKSSYTERTDMQKSWDWWGKPQEKQLL